MNGKTRTMEYLNNIPVLPPPPTNTPVPSESKSIVVDPTPILLHVHASDSPGGGWVGVFTSSNTPEFGNLRIFKPTFGGFVGMEEMIAFTVDKLPRLFPNRQFKIETCFVVDDEDAGFLKPLLTKALQENGVLAC